VVHLVGSSKSAYSTLFTGAAILPSSLHIHYPTQHNTMHARTPCVQVS
jgi:hypothetical protein